MKKNEPDFIRRCKFTLLVLFSAWLACIVIAPLTVPSNRVSDLSGGSMRIDNARVWGNMNPFAASVYFLGDSLCTEISDHSFYLNGNQMPFCARCTAIFAGLVVGMLVALWLNPKVSLLWLALLALPAVIDGGLQLVSSYQSTNLLRVVTGLLAGIAVSLYLSKLVNAMLAPKAEQEETIA